MGQDISRSAPHLMTVTIDDDGDKEIEIDHPAECTKIVTVRYAAGQEPDVMVSWECLVQYDIEMAGLRREDWPEGKHVVEAYLEAIRGPDWVEHDGGIRFCEDGVEFVEREKHLDIKVTVGPRYCPSCECQIID